MSRPPARARSAPAAADRSATPATARAALPCLRAARERLARLPRDTRDTLFQLAVIAWTIAPHLTHLPPWCGPMVAALLLWRARLALTGAALPGRWTVTALLMLASGLTVWGERTLLGKEAGITLLVVLMSLKTLELRARRDALVVFFLGFFLVLTHFLYSQSLATGAWLLVSTWGLLTALVLAHMPVGRPTVAAAARVAARAALFGVPVLVALFALFPRMGPLWGLPQDAAGRTGLSGSLRLGGVASVADDDSVALRVRFDGGRAPRADQLYFRGPVLSTFDGREWTRLVPNFPVELRPRLHLQPRGAPLRYELTLEPSRLTVLPLLEMTPDAGDGAPRLPGRLLTLRPDAQWQADGPLVERVRVQATAYLDHRHGPLEPVLGLRDLVDLPPGANPRTLQWAAELRRRLPDADADALSDAVLRHVREGGYTYTMEPGSYAGDAIDDFWLDRKLGFCEHFASAYVVVMRALDVPARLVTGYQGADPAPVDGYWVVRQRNAHAWAEIWTARGGWQRVDPTAAVAPDRVRLGRSLQAPQGALAQALGGLDPAFAGRLRQAWEGANNRWNQWVLNYSRGQQDSLLKSLGFNAPAWQDLVSMLIALLCTAALTGAAWAWWDRRRQDPWQRLQARVAAWAAGRGVTLLPHHAPRTRAALLRRALGASVEPLASRLDALDAQRYGAVDGAGAPGATALRRWWRGFAADARRVAAVAGPKA